ncbi:DUF2207 domain-containing protein [archaeon]|nr:DUF2207 domain-containing protein [archaeon]
MKKLIALLFLLVVVLSASANAKNYFLEKAEVSMQIMPDGYVKAEEKITFRFDGAFTNAYRDFPSGKWDYKNIKVFEGDKELGKSTELVDGAFRVKWYYSAVNQEKTFKITYGLKNAIKSYDDVTEFYWKVWGSGWEKQLKELTGSIELPEAVNDANEVYSWGHPELNGKIGLIENRKLVFQAFDIPAGQWVEIRLAFPSRLLASKENVQVIEGNGLQEIINEEESFKAAEARLEPVKFLKFHALWLAPLLVLLVFIIAWHKYGREPKVDYEAIYEREPPFDYSPAIVSSLMDSLIKKPSTTCFTAVILDLCLKGYFKLNKVKAKKLLGLIGREFDYEIILQKKALEALKEGSLEGMTGQERMVFGLVARDARKHAEKNKEALSFKAIESYFMADRMKASKWFIDWTKEVEKEAEGMDFFSKKNTAYFFYFVGVAAILVVFAFIEFAAAMIAVLLALCLPFVVFRDALPNRTEKGALHYQKWMKLKAFLKDFSSLQQVPPDAIVLWEKY